MAIAFSQAYTFRHFVRPFDGTDAGTKIPAREFLYEFKESLLAAGWTVMASHAGDGTVDNSGITANVDGLGGGAGVDYWTSAIAIHPINTSNDPWIVLQCHPSHGDVQVCLQLTRFGGGLSNIDYWDVAMSPAGQFLTANGGTDGAANTMPTAPDQILTANDLAFINPSHQTYEIHCAYTADKSQMFLFVQQEQSVGHFWAFSVLDNPDANLDNDAVWTMRQYTGLGGSDITNPSSTTMDNGDHYTTASWYGLVSGTLRTMYLGGRGWNNVGIQSQVRPPASGQVLVGPAELYASDVTVRGFYGTVPDLYWSPNSQYHKGLGDSVGGPVNWYSGGSLIIPWDNTQPLPRVR
jgi:hypothetical protein